MIHGTVELECCMCATRAIVRNQLVGEIPLERWWRMVGQRCRDCRARAERIEHLKALSHNAGHDTEHAAARSMDEISGRLRQQVYTLLAKAWPEGLTDDEGGALMGGQRLTFGRRRKELVDTGFVIKTDQRRTTPTGRMAIVWRLKEAP